jgi:hypothetical protein
MALTAGRLWGLGQRNQGITIGTIERAFLDWVVCIYIYIYTLHDCCMNNKHYYSYYHLSTMTCRACSKSKQIL